MSRWAFAAVRNPDSYLTNVAADKHFSDLATPQWW